jgi:hypothetical protein
LPNDNGLGGTIGDQHYSLWRSHFGMSAGSGSGVNLLGQASVPEPAGCVLAVAAICMLLGKRRSRVEV